MTENHEGIFVESMSRNHFCPFLTKWKTHGRRTKERKNRDGERNADRWVLSKGIHNLIYAWQMSSPGRNGHTWNWLSLKFQRDYYCNQSLFLQSPLWKLTATKEQTLLTTSSLFQKLPLVVTVKWKLMLHQEIQLKYPRIQTLSLKIAVSVKCLNSLVIQVCKDLELFFLLLLNSTLL